MTPSNTTPKQPGGVTGKGFVKGDPRINRRGRPKSFDQLRALAQMIANEVGATDADGKPHTNAEMALRKMLKDETAKFLEIGYGKVPQPIEHSGKDGKPIETKDVTLTDDERLKKLAALIERTRQSGAGQPDSPDDPDG